MTADEYKTRMAEYREWLKNMGPFNHGFLDLAATPPRMVFEQDWKPTYLKVEDGGADMTYSFESNGNDNCFVQLRSYHARLLHETFKVFEGKRLRITVEVVE